MTSPGVAVTASPTIVHPHSTASIGNVASLNQVPTVATAQVHKNWCFQFQRMEVSPFFHGIWGRKSHYIYVLGIFWPSTQSIRVILIHLGTGPFLILATSTDVARIYSLTTFAFSYVVVCLLSVCIHLSNPWKFSYFVLKFVLLHFYDILQRFHEKKFMIFPFLYPLHMKKRLRKFSIDHET